MTPRNRFRVASVTFSALLCILVLGLPMEINFGQINEQEIESNRTLAIESDSTPDVTPNATPDSNADWNDPKQLVSSYVEGQYDKVSDEEIIKYPPRKKRKRDKCEMENVPTNKHIKTNEIETEDYQCPHPDFVKKHFCQDCHSLQDAMLKSKQRFDSPTNWATTNSVIMGESGAMGWQLTQNTDGKFCVNTKKVSVVNCYLLEGKDKHSVEERIERTLEPLFHHNYKSTEKLETEEMICLYIGHQCTTIHDANKKGHLNHEWTFCDDTSKSDPKNITILTAPEAA